MSNTDFTTLTPLDCPLLEQPTNDMCMGDLIKLLAFNTAVLERMVVNSIAPAGVVSYFAGQESDVPPRFLVCDGSFYSPDTYPELFAKIRYTYGRDGDNCFAVPDLRVSVIQGLAMGSGCMDDGEAALWIGKNPTAGGAIQGNVVGSRIKHANPQPTYSTAGSEHPAEGESIFGKMALIPVITTGELCGRYEIQSTSTTGCNNNGGDHTLDLNGEELCILNSQGVVTDCVSLSGIGETVLSATNEYIPPETLLVEHTVTFPDNGGEIVVGDDAGEWGRETTVNNVALNTVTGASVASNVITLPAGTYDVTGWRAIYNVQESALAIFEAGTTNLIAMGARGYGGADGYNHSPITSTFVLPTQTDISIRLKVQTTNNSPAISPTAQGQSDSLDIGFPSVHAQFRFSKIE